MIPSKYSQILKIRLFLTNLEHLCSILRTVLANDEEKVIRSTLQRLPPQYVATLVNELTLMTQQKTSK